jgi:hypothetical protein
VVLEQNSERMMYFQFFVKNVGYVSTGCLKIRVFRIQSVVRKDPVELEKYLEKKIALPEEDIP